jgi:hypothetical protein
VTALSLIAFAYAGGITFISDAVFAGLLFAEALIPYALDKWFGLNGNWFLLVGGVLLIFTCCRTRRAWRVTSAPDAGSAAPGRVTIECEKRSRERRGNLLNRHARFRRARA